MITLQTTGRHYPLDDAMVAYVDQKIGKLDKYLPRAARDGLFGNVVLESDESRDNGRYVCDVQIEVKGEVFCAKEATVNMFAAIDICEAKLKSQFLTYKSKHQPSKNRRGKLLAKLISRAPLSEPSGTNE